MTCTSTSYFFATKRISADAAPGLRIPNRQRARYPFLDIPLVGAEDFDGHFDGQALWEAFFRDSVEGPDGSGQGSARNEAAVSPFVADVDAFFGGLPLAI